ncbi:MAG: ATP-dependent 6-phosphofructokinase [Bacteroidota bacterium]|jgi:6-phosphofructokinase 1|nr:ATP-dependent 6-phosphofructokinase [Bacteroidota bacterium]
MRIGVLTGGGDCPGLNPVIRAIVRVSLKLGHETVGFRNGWKGLLENITMPLDRESVSGILHRGGTILGTSRTNPYKVENGEATIIANLEKSGIDALIPIGGEDTLGVAVKLHNAGVKLVGVPKTIDNDLMGTDFTFGFDTAVNIAMEAIDRLHSTAESHSRVLVVEVMGRHAGWITWYAGIAGGGDVILVPEHPFNVEDVCARIKRRHATGKNFSIVVVSEGAKVATDGEYDEDGSYVLKSMKKDAFGHVMLGGVARVLAEEIENRLGFETRHTVLGHIQRGGSPSAFDRVLGTRYGVRAAELAHEGRFGRMVALQSNKIVDIDITEISGAIKELDPDLYTVAEYFAD